MAVDVWFTFSQAFVRAGDRGKSSKRFRIYSAYSWLAPLLFVLPAVFIQILDDDSPVNPRYGEEICWVANLYALLIFFAAPVLLLLIFNVVFFSISVRNIAHARATTARMLGKEDKQKMGIYVRLTVVMGLTWTLGFVEAIIPHELLPAFYIHCPCLSDLRYSFVLMNTLQGLFMCISFVCTKKVIQLLKDKVRGKSLKISKSRSTDLTTVSKSASLGIQALSFSSTQPT
ncbi:G-protein coupled receptor Mth-like [Pomacea canaliculata]|uniref:G-protein coupled receptor Mth-like n=1 Tax=Pomacea canaliculata TaxID=400727 RepID=UPI000D731F2D|nr:G-protein coupled receptor Mth-like [Pomacea canaliculata]